MTGKQNNVTAAALGDSAAAAAAAGLAGWQPRAATQQQQQRGHENGAETAAAAAGAAATAHKADSRMKLQLPQTALIKSEGIWNRAMGSGWAVDRQGRHGDQAGQGEASGWHGAGVAGLTSLCSAAHCTALLSLSFSPSVPSQIPLSL